MNMFELLVVLNFENRTVELTGLAFSQKFDNNNICPQLSRAKEDITQ